MLDGGAPGGEGGAPPPAGHRYSAGPYARRWRTTPVTIGALVARAEEPPVPTRERTEVAEVASKVIAIDAACAYLRMFSPSEIHAESVK